MQVNIIVPYRPLSRGMLSTPLGEQHQLPDGRWTGWEGEPCYDTFDVRNDVSLTIRSINKNSTFKHKIVVAIDSDVYPKDDFLKEFDNVTVLKSSYACKEASSKAYWRLNAAYKDAINSIPDEEWLCHGFTADLICGRNWDRPVMDAIAQNGDSFVYVPMFVEAYASTRNIKLKGTDPTPELIWNVWRKEICCHALTMPEPAKGFITQDDFEYFIKRANEKPMGLIREPCGERTYGYYNVMFMKAKYAKKAMRLFGFGFDIDFDDRLRDVLHMTKIVVTNSFVLHPVNTPFKEE